MRKIDDISNARVPELALRFYVSYISRAQKSNLCRVAYLLSRLERKLLSRCMIIYRFSKYRVIEFIFNKLIIGNIAFYSYIVHADIFIFVDENVTLKTS